jgi:DNA-binding response OmpR family regulator
MKDAAVRILIMTVRDGEEDRALAFEAGANGYVRKPYSIPDLMAYLSDDNN